METTVKFYRCNHCGNLVYVIDDGHVNPVCCGEPMELLKPGTSDGALEKHVPAVTLDDNHINVNIGEVDHPMLPEHHIEWVALVDGGNICIKRLQPGDKPHVVFGQCPHAEHGDRYVYEYCNIHGLYVTKF